MHFRALLQRCPKFLSVKNAQTPPCHFSSAPSGRIGDLYRRKLKLFKSRPLLPVDTVRELIEGGAVDDGFLKSRLVVLDTVFQADNNTAEFEAEHLPKAQHFYLNEVVQKTDTKIRSLVHPLIFQDYARQLGIGKDSLVVLYDHGEVKNAVLSATYAHWLFRVYGHKYVGIMNGGLKAWKAGGLPVETGASQSPREVEAENLFFATWEPEEIASLTDVPLLKEKWQFLDARKIEQFSGEEKAPAAKAGGKLKGAANIPTSDFIDESGMLLEGAAIENLVNEKMRKGHPVMTYCNTAFQSSGLHFVLKNAGVKSRNYDGSWVEFSHLGDEGLKEM